MSNHVIDEICIRLILELIVLTTKLSLCKKTVTIRNNDRIFLQINFTQNTHLQKKIVFVFIERVAELTNFVAPFFFFL